MKPALVGALALLFAASSTRVDAAPRDLAAQIPGAGLAFLGGEIPSYLPSAFSHPGFSQTLLDCPLTSSDTALKVTDVQASVKVSSVQLVPESTGRLRIKITASASGHLYGAANPCYLGDVKCRFDFSLGSTQASASFLPTIVGGKLKLGSPQIDLAVQKDQLAVHASSCGMVGSVINLVLPAVKGWLVGKLEAWLEQTLLENLPPEVEKALADFAQVSGTAAGLSASAALEAASVATGGVTLGLQVSVKPVKSAACTLPKATTVTGVTSTPSFSFQGEHLGLALSRSTLSEALTAAWSAGYFCLSDGQLAGLGLSSTIKPIAGIAFGLSSTDSLSVHVHQQPKLSLTPGSGTAAQISIPALAIELKGKSAKGSATVTATVSAAASVKLILDPVTRAVAVESVKTTLGTPKITSTDPAISPNPVLVEKLLTDVVLPLVEKQLGGLELLPQVVRQSGGILDPYFLYLARGVTVPDYASLYVRIYKQPASDSASPTTLFEKKPAALSAPQLFRFVAAGSDLETPSPLLRFSWRVDGGSWSTPAYSRARLVSLADGKHSVEVRAVDLSGKSDPSPASASFVVDGIRPTLAVTPPPAQVQAAATQASFVASDDRTPASELEVSVKLEHRASPSAAFATVREDPFAKATGNLALTALQDGDYRLTLVARDSVGNLSDPALASFSVAGGSTPSPSSPGSPGSPTGPGAWGTPVEKSPDAEDPAGNVEGGCSLGPRTEAGELPAALLILLVVLLGIRGRGRRPRR
jgi:hypothetical protein